ncbi:hypothetical protein AGMMS50225_19150 [Betaproteobacteria bacterium]|nr:hypothetical protein AGMMS50225_19150 [Betaproteobacteria bacterium]
MILNTTGLLDGVEQAISEMSKGVQITWEYVYEWDREWPLMANFAEKLGLDERAVDELFIAAAAL